MREEQRLGVMLVWERMAVRPIRGSVRTMGLSTRDVEKRLKTICKDVDLCK